MKASGIFITGEELAQLKSEQELTGMWGSDGTPFGDPQAAVRRLIANYSMPESSGLNARNGEFWVPDDWQPAKEENVG